MGPVAKRQEFEAPLVAKGPGGAWTFLSIPFSVADAFGKKSRVPVCGTINGFEFRNSLMPEGDGSHSMMVGKDLQVGARARAGDVVKVSLELDESPRSVEVPVELQRAFDSDSVAQTAFAALAYSHQKEYADWIASAKKPETKTARVVKAVSLLKAGVKRLR